MADQVSEVNGRLVARKATGSALEVDCSGWCDMTGWTVGNLVAKKMTQPAAECDFIRSPNVWLELLVSFEPNTAPAAVIEHTNRMIAAVARAVPELRLTYDFTRSRAEKDTAVIVLMPTAGNDVEKQLNDVVGVIRQELQVTAKVARAA